MVTANERPVAEEARRQPALLHEQVERDMVETLLEFGSPAAESKPQAEIRGVSDPEVHLLSSSHDLP